MPIKRFVAETWDEALKQVRAEFGENAVILSSKTFKDGGVLGVGTRSVVEITASNDPEIARLGPALNARSAAAADLPEADQKNYSRLLEKAYAIASTRAEAAGADQGGGARPSGGRGQEGQQRGGEQPRRNLPIPGTQSGQQGNRPTASGLFKSGSGRNEPPIESERIESLMHDVSELKALVARLASGHAGSEMAGATAALQALHQRLMDHDVSPELAKRICGEVNRELTGTALDNEDTVRETAVRVIARMIPVAGPVNMGPGKCTVIALVGPTGVGKTTTLSKLAANLIVRDKGRVGFVTIDTYRLGATEQLRTLANVLDVPMRVVMSPSEMRTTVREMSNLEMVFIDTAGRSHRDRLKMNELKMFLDAAAPDETHLCLPATTHPSHLLSVMDHFGGLQVDKVILTKLDEAGTYGPVLDIVLRCGKPVSYMTIGQNIPDDIEAASGERLARLMLGYDLMEE